jgi:hypothetical protein
LTQVEGLPGDLKGGTFCMNQGYVAAPRMVWQSFDAQQGSSCGNMRKSILSRRRNGVRGSGGGRRAKWRPAQGVYQYIRIVRSDPNTTKGIRSFTSMLVTSFRISRLSSGCENMRNKASNISTLRYCRKTT